MDGSGTFGLSTLAAKILHMSRSEKKYTSSAMLSKEMPMNRPRNPPQAARNSNFPDCSDRFFVINSFSA